MRIGIVTGASSGIGREFALQVPGAFDLDEVWLVARRKERLTETSAMINCGIGVPCELDLVSDGEIERLAARLRDVSPEVCVLANCAGVGLVSGFADSPVGRLEEMVDLNVGALVRLTHMALPYMSRGGVIFQLASINGFMPLAGGAVYAASKAFVLNFSHALKKELEPSGIHVMSVSPGPVDTEFMKVATGGRSGSYAGSADPAKVVSKAIRDAGKKRLNSTYGLGQKMNIVLSRILTRRMILALTS